VEARDRVRVYQVFQDMLNSGVRPTSWTFSLLLTLCARMRDEKSVPRTLRFMTKHGIDYDPSIYRTLLNVYAETKNEKRVYELLAEMLQKGIKPCKIAYNTVIKLHTSLGEKEKAFKIFSKMVQEGIRPTDATYRTLLSLYIKDEKNSDELFLEMKKWGVYPDQDLYDSLVTYFHAVHPNIKTEAYNGLLRWCVAFRDKEAFFRFYKEMLSSGITPNLTTYKYHLMLSLLCDLEIDELLNEIKENCGEVEAGRKALPLEIYFILIEFHRVNKSDDSLINRYLDELVVRGIEQSQVDEGFRSALQELPKSGLKKSKDNFLSDPITYGKRISVLYRRRDEIGLLKVLAEMERNQVKPSHGIIVLLFKFYAAIKKQEEGIDKVNALMKKYDIKHNIYTYASLLNVHVKNKNSPDAYKVMQEMEENGVEPNAATYRILLVHHVKNKNLKRSLEIIKIMKEKGMDPAIWSYNGVLSLCMEKGDKATYNLIFQELTDMGLKPSKNIYFKYVKSCFYNEKFSEAYEWLNEFKSIFGKWSFEIYEFLIHYYMEHNGQDWVNYYHQEMLAVGFTEDKINLIFDPVF
jgi:pentatricopeptide repeat protein